MGISIIIPIYNMEKYIHRCLDSILKQDYNDLEVLLVNDGSQDNSLAICQEYASKDNRVIVINKTNGGVASARNAALAKVSKKYLLFIDPDDYVEPNMFSELNSLASKYDADLIWSNFYMNKDGDIRENRMFKELAVFNLNKEADLLKFASNLDKKYKMSAYPVTKMYRSSIFKDIRFPLNRQCEDGFILMEIMVRVKKIVLNPKAYYHYCQRPDGLCLGQRNDNWSVDWIESRILQALTYDDWCKSLDNGQREYMLYRAYRNALLFMPIAMRPKYQASFPILKGKLKELLHSKMPLRHKLSVLKVLLKYKWKFER